ncbi:hypothetical protein BT67DRAFT_491297 [Trichocladium antarcticum]|uniref:Uncharacterized protein n=1 Tax=Trichocladium antarcticum TaxID=1450529 RepID=A0AAN6UNE4_9PEZI|nr:hypothetical protein BT67DRAFT_491297 [Trichocladium antarcticum]
MAYYRRRNGQSSRQNYQQENNGHSEENHYQNNQSHYQGYQGNGQQNQGRQRRSRRNLDDGQNSHGQNQGQGPQGQNGGWQFNGQAQYQQRGQNQQPRPQQHPPPRQQEPQGQHQHRNSRSPPPPDQQQQQQQQQEAMLQGYVEEDEVDMYDGPAAPPTYWANTGPESASYWPTTPPESVAYSGHGCPQCHFLTSWLDASADGPLSPNLHQRLEWSQAHYDLRAKFAHDWHVSLQRTFHEQLARTYQLQQEAAELQAAIQESLELQEQLQQQQQQQQPTSAPAPTPPRTLDTAALADHHAQTVALLAALQDSETLYRQHNENGPDQHVAAAAAATGFTALRTTAQRVQGIIRGFERQSQQGGHFWWLGARETRLCEQWRGICDTYLQQVAGIEQQVRAEGTAGGGEAWARYNAWLGGMKGLFDGFTRGFLG